MSGGQEGRRYPQALPPPGTRVSLAHGQQPDPEPRPAAAPGKRSPPRVWVTLASPPEPGNG